MENKRNGQNLHRRLFFRLYNDEMLEAGAEWLAVEKVQKYKALAFKSIVRVH